MRVLSLTVGISFPDFSVRVLSYLGAIWKHDIFLTISKLNSFDSIFLDTLDCTIREYTLFFTICKDTLYCAIREAKLLW